MRWLGKALRHILVWWLPGLVLLFALACGFVLWLVASQTGTRLLLATAVSQFGGRADDVRGSLLGGVQVGRFVLALPGVAVDADDLSLSVAWPELWRRRLHVREVSAGALHVALNETGAPAPTAESPASVPVLPVSIAVDRLAVGDFSLLRDGQPLPVTLDGLQASLSADAQGVQVRIASLRVGHQIGQTDVQAELNLHALADPWPLDAHVIAAAHGTPPDSPLCLDRYVAAPVANLPVVPAAKPGAAAAECTVVADARIQGSLQEMTAVLTADGAGATLALHATLTPRAAVPLRTAALDLRLPDRSGASVTLDSQQAADAAAGQRVSGTLTADRLDLARFLGNTLPPALLSARATFDADLTGGYVLRRGGVSLDIGEGSRWNRQPLRGKVSAKMATGAQDDAAAAWPAALTGVRVDGLDVDLLLGRNRLRAQGSMGPAAGAITLNADAPDLGAFWPGLKGGATAQGKLAGTPARHQAELRASYAPANAKAGVLGQAKAEVALALAGGWGPGTGKDPAAALVGWRGTVSRLTASHAGFDLASPRPVTVAFLPDAAAPLWQWQVGAASVAVGLPSGDRVTIEHAGSRGGGVRWETAGHMDNFVLTPALLRGIRNAVDTGAAAAPVQRPGRVNAAVPQADRRIALDASWDLKFAGTLAGKVHVVRRGGDMRIPGDPPIPLGLRTLALDVAATPVSASSSRLDATLDLSTAKMGAIKGSGSAILAVDKDGGMALAARQPLRVRLDANISDLAWLGLFTGDALELGGSLKANIDAQGTPGGAWQANGTIHGQNLRLVRIDDGVRLVEGTLSARLQDDRLILESLRFPASLRVVPTEARTREWISTNPDAKNGYIDASGEWSLMRSAGKVHVVLHRFPALQRADRYAMISGLIDIDADLPRIAITGDLKADAGWVSLEVLSGVPTLDDDVKVYRAGDQAPEASTPLQLSMNLKVDLGPRFYITGMGLDAGLVGAIQIQYANRSLTGTGALRTRGGRVEAYGQRLQIRNGTITFQGNLENPLLDIEALRTGDQVEAGVKVSGTAQRPRIDLISYPDVSDVEKLSWLVLGRGPDASGNDTALLVSVGTALLGGGQPFYQQFGLDDVSVRTGSVGNSGSLLPDRTVAGDVNMNSDSTLATQFLVASKNFSNGITLSVEQALAGAETVGRASYRLARGLSIDLKGGAVNGIELVYRKFFNN